jgi:hypothetical protein
MTTRILKFKYTTNTKKYTDDIKFCGGNVRETTKLGKVAVYITIEEPIDFVRKFRDTRSSAFLLN